MSKLDNIFRMVISDPGIQKEYNIDLEKYDTVKKALDSRDPFVQSIATIVSMLDQKIEAKKMDMRIHRDNGPVVLEESDNSAIYRKVVSILSKS